MKLVLFTLAILMFLFEYTQAQEKPFPRHCVDWVALPLEYEIEKARELPVPGEATLGMRVYYRRQPIQIVHLPGRVIRILGRFVWVEERGHKFVFLYRPLKERCAKTRYGIRLRLQHRYPGWDVEWLH